MESRCSASTLRRPYEFSTGDNVFLSSASTSVITAALGAEKFVAADQFDFGKDPIDVRWPIAHRQTIYCYRNPKTKEVLVTNMPREDLEHIGFRPKQQQPTTPARQVTQQELWDSAPRKNQFRPQDTSTPAPASQCFGQQSLDPTSHLLIRQLPFTPAFCSPAKLSPFRCWKPKNTLAAATTSDRRKFLEQTTATSRSPKSVQLPEISGLSPIVRMEMERVARKFNTDKTYARCLLPDSQLDTDDSDNEDLMAAEV